MPALPTINALYIKKIRDLLRTGINYRTAQLVLGSGTSGLLIQAQDPGLAGNNITVTITVPAGTSGIAVSLVGTAISIALAVSSGTPTAANTATAIAAALNGNASILALARTFVTGSGAGLYAAAVATTALAGGAQGSNRASTQTLPLNFLRAQDMASVLQLLSDALDTAAITATAGTTNSVSKTSAFVANSQVGNTVVFTGNTTAALAGVRAVVISNTVTQLVFANNVLPAAPASGDTFTIVGSLVDPIISKLRDGRGPADSPAGNEYGDARLVTDAIVRMTRQLGGTMSDGLIYSGATLGTSTTTSVKVNTVTMGRPLRIDMFKNRRIVISGQTRKIVGNDESSIFFDLPLSSAPASATSFTINSPIDSSDATDVGQFTFAPGGQPGNNRKLAEMLRILEAAVVAFTIPT